MTVSARREKWRRRMRESCEEERKGEEEARRRIRQKTNTIQENSIFSLWKKCPSQERKKKKSLETEEEKLEKITPDKRKRNRQLKNIISAKRKKKEEKRKLCETTPYWNNEENDIENNIEVQWNRRRQLKLEEAEKKEKRKHTKARKIASAKNRENWRKSAAKLAWRPAWKTSSWAAEKPSGGGWRILAMAVAAADGAGLQLKTICRRWSNGESAKKKNSAVSKYEDRRELKIAGGLEGWRLKSDPKSSDWKKTSPRRRHEEEEAKSTESETLCEEEEAWKEENYERRRKIHVKKKAKSMKKKCKSVTKKKRIMKWKKTSYLKKSL